MVTCHICANNFYSKPSWIERGFGKYCSNECKRKAQKTGLTVSCFMCNKEIYKTQKALKGSKSGKFFCGKSCQTKWRNSEFVGAKHANFITGKSSYKSVLSRANVEKICGLCANKDKRVLAVHHVDENHFNNNIENLAWLCHNCHHLVHHDKVEKQKFIALRGLSRL